MIIVYNVVPEYEDKAVYKYSNMVSKKVPTVWEHLYSEKLEVSTEVKDKIIIPFLLSEEFSECFKQKTILDMGCGQGYVAEQLLQKYSIKQYVGVDNSSTAIKQASKAATGFQPAHPTFFKMDCRSLAFKEHSFDTIISINLIPTIGDEDSLRKTFAESIRVCRPNGNLLLITTNERVILSGLKSEFFQPEIVDQSSIPIRYNLTLKKVDGTEVSFPDFCWPTDFIVSFLNTTGFRVLQIEELQDPGASTDFRPFLFIRAVKSKV